MNAPPPAIVTAAPTAPVSARAPRLTPTAKLTAVEGIADKELSGLLATDRVIPVAHGTTFEALRDVSPLLAARSGLSTEGSSLEEVAAKVADTVRVKDHT